MVNDLAILTGRRQQKSGLLKGCPHGEPAEITMETGEYIKVGQVDVQQKNPSRLDDDQSSMDTVVGYRGILV